MKLNDLIYNLLFDTNFRSEFLEGSNNFLKNNGFSEDFKTIDKSELLRTANKITRSIISGAEDYEGGLKQSFKQTFDYLRINNDIESLIRSFQMSDCFKQYSETTFSEIGCCIEEAFYLFLSERQEEYSLDAHGLIHLTSHEFLTSMFSILVKNKKPGFEIMSFRPRVCGDSKFIISRYPTLALQLWGKDTEEQETSNEVFYLYASARDRLISGPVSALTVKLLDIGSVKDFEDNSLKSDAKENGSYALLKDLLNELVDLGLINDNE